MKKKSEPKPAPKKSSPDKPAAKKDFIVVGLGASAGGIKPLKEFFATMPPASGMAFVVVLHLSPMHESNLAEILQTQTTMPVVQVNKTLEVEPNNVYVIPPTRNLEMTDGVIHLTEQDDQRGPRAAIDIFFRSLAEAYDSNAVCIVLSGTGADGTLGLKRVKEANGFAIVQDPRDAEYSEMPRSAIATRLADWVLPVGKIPQKLLDFRDSSRRLHLTTGDIEKVTREIKGQESLRDILTLLRVRTGHDFSNYKPPTLVRRIARNLQIHELEDIPSYLEFLRQNPEEINSLLRNLLINVTNFFRDPKAFETLETQVIPKLFEDKTAKDTVRVWVAACASGEEAYSVAMLLVEHADKLHDPPRIQIFASDVDDEALQEAREHFYPETIEADVSPERLRRFFIKEENSYRIKKELREMILFAPHNLLRDPPFSRLDLITCRNLLIYLTRETQEKVMQIFHFALRLNGFLFLGSSESAENASELFVPVNKKHRLYKRRSLPGHPVLTLPQMPLAGRWQTPIAEVQHGKPGDVRFSYADLHRQIIEEYAPPSVLVNENLDIIYMSRTAGRYLRFSGGEPTSNLIKLIHPDLIADTRAGLFVAQRDKKPSEFKNVRAQIDGSEITVNIIARPIEVSEIERELLLVLFEEVSESSDGEKFRKTLQQAKQDDALEAVVNRLEDDLDRTKANLRSTVEQYETTVEELKASNEELQAINEELRSASEELETSKEELQSVNEELTTVNHEFKEKIDEGNRINADLQNLIASTDIATIFLDRAMQIKRYTPPVQRLFNIQPADIGRPLRHFTHALKYEELSEDADQVLQTLKPLEREVSDEENRRYLARFHPYLTPEDKVEGVVLNFIDITEHKEIEDALRKTQVYLDVAMEAGGMGVWDVDLTTGTTQTNLRHNQIFGYKKPVKKWSPEIFREHMLAEDRAKLDKAFAEAMETGIFDLQARVRWSDGSIHWIYDCGRVIYDEHKKPRRMTGVTSEITERKEMQERLLTSERRFRTLVESVVDFAIITTDEKNFIETWNIGAEKIFGYTANEIVGRTGDILFTAEDRAKGEPEKEIKTAREKGRAEDERWHVRKNGEIFYASGVMMPLIDGGESGFVKIARDRTEKMKAEAAQSEKQMLRQLVATQEDERRRIARDIHDHLGQQLTALRLKLEQLREICDDQKICDEIELVQKTAERLDKDVDFLAWELRPAALDDLGLRATLGNFVKEWSLYSGIEAGFHTAGLGKKRLPFEIETNLYRIAQEALNNIQKHAEAKTVSVLLEKRGDTLTLIVEDDGKGFSVKNKKNRGTGLGLVGMSERAKIIGGDLEIESAKGKGTTVFVRVPFAEK